ncbi:hypothetical protein [Tenacibaculum ovolyticum]|uniref:hypothetical protein n=1 Tax=Tenacibaculum ovolyticum TaxID=104270 RepID=UPI0004150C04|nr:hypothetical protein [Tenacibaculum ovolyticum]
MDENTSIISVILLVGVIVYTLIFRASFKLKMNTNVYLLLVAYFTAPISLLLTLLVLSFTIYKTHKVKSKLNKFIFWWILINTVFTILPYAKDKLSNNTLSFNSDAAGNALVSGTEFIMQIVFQFIMLLITVVVFFIHKNYVQKKQA